MTHLDLDAARQWARQCGSCDAGLPMSCTCPTGDPRTVIAALLAERDQYASILAEIGDSMSPTGERPGEALGTLARDVRALLAEIERLRGIVRDLLDAWEVGTAPADVMARARALFATRGGAA